jgi:hypothetical protein
MVFNPKFQLYSDKDMARIFESLPMSNSDRRVFSEDYAQVKRSQISNYDVLTEYGIRIANAEDEIIVINERLEVIEQRLDDVEAVAYMALIT